VKPVGAPLKEQLLKGSLGDDIRGRYIDNAGGRRTSQLSLRYA